MHTIVMRAPWDVWKLPAVLRKEADELYVETSIIGIERLTDVLDVAAMVPYLWSQDGHLTRGCVSRIRLDRLLTVLSVA